MQISLHIWRHEITSVKAREHNTTKWLRIDFTNDDEVTIFYDKMQDFQPLLAALIKLFPEQAALELDSLHMDTQSELHDAAEMQEKETNG